jgi:hypothetical protein
MSAEPENLGSRLGMRSTLAAEPGPRHDGGPRRDGAMARRTHETGRDPTSHPAADYGGISSRETCGLPHDTDAALEWRARRRPRRSGTANRASWRMALVN